ncbi:hypothetical protein [Niveibacterium terrae]|uniref:hypothetical protein n=1 Tax=Niveibacterium terrae TaxID=3373598 RepID=UPI003A8E7BDA
MKTALLLLALALSLAPAAQAIDTTAFQSAFGILQKARSGDSAAADASVAAFEQLLRQDPGNPLLHAYLGSSATLQGSHALLPWNKMKYTEDGLAEIDKALRLLGPQHDQQNLRGVPISLETRLVAASTFLALPGLFKRSTVGHQQLQALLTHPELATSPEGFRRSVVDLALKTARREQLPTARITAIGLLASGSETERRAAQTQLKEIWQ